MFSSKPLNGWIYTENELHTDEPNLLMKLHLKLVVGTGLYFGALQQFYFH